MADALAKVKKDLGKDAVILHTRTLTRGGLLGLGARSIIEITATADGRVRAFRSAAQEADELPSPRPTPRMQPLFDYAAAEVRGPSAPRSGVRGLGRPVVEGVALDERSAPSIETVPNHAVATRAEQTLREEMNEIRGLVRDLARRVQGPGEDSTPEELAEYHAMLLARDVEPDLASEIIARLGERLQCQAAFQGRQLTAGVAPDSVHVELRKTITDMLPPAAPLKLRDDNRPSIVALVGPTGVGKTTTIAKLAANMKLRENKRVGLITIDSYRIAAVEQLRTYAQILRVPVVSVLKPDEMESAIESMRDLDLILIDTAGRSQKDGLRIAELHEFIRVANPDQIHLVMSTTSKEKTVREAIDRFRLLGAMNLLFTKLDEAEGLGMILNVLRDTNMQISYLTTGQAVPDDIEIGSASRVAKLILGDMDERAAIAASPTGSHG